MLQTYINYPNQKVSVHGDRSCQQIGKMAKAGQQRFRIDSKSISMELQHFGGKQYMFAPNAADNDMWIEVDFSDAEFERAVVAYVHRLIGRRYSRLAKASIETQR